MIRAGRASKVRTLADLAEQRGVSLNYYTQVKPYRAEGFPAPVSSPGTRTLLFDGEQVDAFLAGEPVPDLPTADHDDDLLDRREAAALIGVVPASWEVYKKRPELHEHMVVVGGVEHWPRGTVEAFREARDNRPRTGGRPKRTGDLVPRDQLHDRITPLLDDDPALTAGRVTEELGVHLATAQRALAQLRARRIADRITTHPGLSPEQAAAELGYPAGQIRTALDKARTELRAREAAGYLQTVARALADAGLLTAPEPVAVEQNDDTLRAALLLTPDAPVPALVWEEETGWRTAGRRRHPYTSPDTHPLLPGHPRPAPADLLAALTT